MQKSQRNGTNIYIGVPIKATRHHNSLQHQIWLRLWWYNFTPKLKCISWQLFKFNLTMILRMFYWLINYKLLLPERTKDQMYGVSSIPKDVTEMVPNPSKKGKEVFEIFISSFFFRNHTRKNTIWKPHIGYKIWINCVNTLGVVVFNRLEVHFTPYMIKIWYRSW